MSILENFPERLRSTDVCYRFVGNNSIQGNLSCGFLCKPDESGSNRDIIFDHYGGLLLLDGSGVYEGPDGVRRQLSPGSFIQRLPGVCHSTWVNPDGRWLEFFLCISSQSYENLAQMGLMSREEVLFCEEPQEFVPRMNRLLSTMKRSGQGELVPCFFEVQALLCELTARCTQPQSGMTLAQEACRIIGQAKGRIGAEEVAQRLEVPYETLRREFRAAMGLPLGQYAIQVRINEAKALLMHTQIPLGELALSLGYPDYFSFCKQFKQHTGTTPRQFRSMR